MPKKNKHQGWIANLNSGETVFEDEQVPGERTPWAKLRMRCEEEGLWVTQIQLQIAGNTWKGISGADGYCWFRDARIEGYVSGNVNRKNSAGIGSVINGSVYCTVINSDNDAKQETRPLASMLAHCQLKPAHAPEISFEDFKEANLRQEAERRLAEHKQAS